MGLRTYRFGDALVRTELFLQTLPEVDAPAGADCLRVAPGAGPRPVRRWRHQWRRDGRVVLGLALSPDGYLIRVPRQCDFFLALDGASLEVRPRAGLEAAVLEHHLVDQVLPRVLSRLGRFALHCSSVATPRGLVLFAGESGRGKSTMAGLLAQRGFRLHSDDCVLLGEHAGQIRGTATYQSLRLFDDSVEGVFAGAKPARTGSYSGKSRLAVEREVPDGPVAAIFLLDEPYSDTWFEATPLPPGSACIELMKNSFQLDVLDAGRTSAQLRLAAVVAARVPVSRLSYAHDFSRSDETVDALCALLGARPPGSGLPPMEAHRVRA
jgi:hypothetical protein